MRLGESVHITFGVKDLDANILFYEKLGFKRLNSATEPWPWVLLTDGYYRLMLNQDSNSYTGLNYFSSNYESVVKHVKDLGLKVVMERTVDEAPQTIFAGPDGLKFGVVGNEAQDDFKPDRRAMLPIGELGELSLRVRKLKKAVKVWKNLGFKTSYHGDEPYPWAILQDGMIPIGLHQSKSIPTRPTMTYSQKDQSVGVKHVKAMGLEIGLELENNGITVTGPDGQEVYIFQW